MGFPHFFNISVYRRICQIATRLIQVQRAFCFMPGALRWNCHPECPCQTAHYCELFSASANHGAAEFADFWVISGSGVHILGSHS